MDSRTVILMLAIGSFLFALLLVVFNFKKDNLQKVPFWIIAKILQAAGSLMLYFNAGTFDGLTVLAHTVLLLGCAYETWAILILCDRQINRRLHIFTSVGIILACSSTIVLDEPYQAGLFFLLQSIFYFLPSLFLFIKSHMKISIYLVLAVSYYIAGLVFFVGALSCFSLPGYDLIPESNAVSGIIPGVSFCIFLISGFILLMLAKERSDRKVLEMQKDLKKSQIRFQQIVETAIEGILIFDEQYRITFANENMASILGYTVDEMIGRPYASFFQKSDLDIYYQQESLRKRGEDSVYECCLLRKDGKKHWFLVSAKALLDDSGKFEGSFAMLADINDRKEMELLLERTNRRLMELSNTDSLTGIANRRCFDSTLIHEYSRLRRSNSCLSVIFLDIDHFKEYNDYYGHIMGDECLRQIGRVLESCINRPVDLAARYGGEEFACILPDTDIHSAMETAEKIRQKILGLKIEHKKSHVSEYVTASLGVTAVKYSTERYPEDIIATADKLLYKAKVSGRNRIEYADMTV